MSALERIVTWGLLNGFELQFLPKNLPIYEIGRRPSSVSNRFGIKVQEHAKLRSRRSLLWRSSSGKSKNMARGLFSLTLREMVPMPEEEKR